MTKRILIILCAVLGVAVVTRMGGNEAGTASGVLASRQPTDEAIREFRRLNHAGNVCYRNHGHLDPGQECSEYNDLLLRYERFEKAHGRFFNVLENKAELHDLHGCWAEALTAYEESLALRGSAQGRFFSTDPSDYPTRTDEGIYANCIKLRKRLSSPEEPQKEKRSISIPTPRARPAEYEVSDLYTAADTNSGIEVGMSLDEVHERMGLSDIVWTDKPSLGEGLNHLEYQATRLLISIDPTSNAVVSIRRW